MEKKLANVYYRPRGYWKGLSVVKKLAKPSRVSEEAAKAWLEKQALWQVNLPPPRRIPCPKFDVRMPNEVHQANLLFLPHDKVGKSTFRYALVVVDIASCFKAAKPLSTKESGGVAAALARLYRRGPLRWPKLLQVDPGREFMGSVSQLLTRNKVTVRRGRPDVHRDQGIVERANRTLAERLFGHQYAQELVNPHTRSHEWVKRLPVVLAALNNEVTRLMGKRPAVAIRSQSVTHKSSSVVPSRQVGLSEVRLPPSMVVRYLYRPGELEGGCRRATDPVWSLKTYKLSRAVAKSGAPIVYHLKGGPSRDSSAKSSWLSPQILRSLRGLYRAAAPLFLLHSRQVSRTLLRVCPWALSRRSMLNWRLSFGV